MKPWRWFSHGFTLNSTFTCYAEVNYKRKSWRKKITFFRQRFTTRRRSDILRLVFTCDGVVVGVVIRSVEPYDLVRIKLMESEAEHRLCLWLRRLRSSQNCIVGVGSGSGRINQSQCSIEGPRKYKFWRQRQHGGRRATCALALINHYFAQAETVQD